MDFEDAAQRLARDQQKLRGRRPVAVSAQAKREAEYRRKQAAQRQQEPLKQQQQRDFQMRYMTSCERALGVKSLAPPFDSSSSSGSSSSSSSNSSTPHLQLSATSIWGEGDKIALPPSVLERLTQSIIGNDDNISTQGSPWIFRIGILNPRYTFPASVLMKTLKPNNDDDEEEGEDITGNDDDDDDITNGNNSKAAFLDELGHKYISYTHGTVVEFTQEEGDIGLPAPMAAALLDPRRRLDIHRDFEISTKRTIDPSASVLTKELREGISDVEIMDTEETNTANKMNEYQERMKENDDDEEDDTEKTPGHIAYGAFDVPNLPIEVSMVRLPKGKGCTLTPTHDAIRNGFYNLKDVKMVLEQSLIRTRATLSVNDTVHTWHRGIKYDLIVAKVLPATYGAVTCINTDIEVEIGEVKDFPESETSDSDDTRKTSQAAATSVGHTLSGGRTLVSDSPASRTKIVDASNNTATAAVAMNHLLPEPPQDLKEGVCTVQIRADGGLSARRRFVVQNATLHDLFLFAQAALGESTPEPHLPSFRLVTRFPRKVFELSVENKGSTMADAGISSGQELMMVERI